MTNCSPNHERRHCFRIEDQAQVEYRVLADESPIQGFDGFPPRSDFTLQSRLRQIDHDLESLFIRLSDHDNALTQILRLLSRKIDWVAQALSDNTGQPFSDEPITLSTDGLSFFCPEPLAIDSLLALRFRLSASGLGITTCARVIYQHTEVAGSRRTGCRFIDLGTPQQELIGQHLLSRDAENKRRYQQETGGERNR